MRASSELVREHRVILSVLLGLEQRLAAASQSGTVPVEYLRRLVSFSREYIDRCHHVKEEGCLFPCLERRGMVPDGGMLAMLLEEHETGRALVVRIATALDRYARGEITGAAVLDPCRAYADLLRQHIIKEDDVLFPISESLLTPGDHDTAGRCFEEREEALGSGAQARLEALAQWLRGTGLADPGAPR